MDPQRHIQRTECVAAIGAALIGAELLGAFGWTAGHNFIL